MRHKCLTSEPPPAAAVVTDDHGPSEVPDAITPVRYKELRR
jgi:hypothetical protein